MELCALVIGDFDESICRLSSPRDSKRLSNGFLSCRSAHHWASAPYSGQEQWTSMFWVRTMLTGSRLWSSSGVNGVSGWHHSHPQSSHEEAEAPEPHCRGHQALPQVRWGLGASAFCKGEWLVGLSFPFPAYQPTQQHRLQEPGGTTCLAINNGANELCLGTSRENPWLMFPGPQGASLLLKFDMLRKQL